MGIENLELAKRLRMLIASEYKTAKAFAEVIGSSESSVSEWMNAVRPPTTTTLQRITQKTGVNIGWLLLGEGEMITDNKKVVA